MPDESLRQLSDVLREEYVRLHEDLPDETVVALAAADDAAAAAPAGSDGDAARKAAEAAKLKAIFAAIHKWNREHPAEARTALCISGGGIRSATFALGVMQRLASFGLLTDFHFLSTVSGGGYIGSWLSSYARRDPKGMARVQQDIKGLPATERNPLSPEVAPLVWLRRFSNYLTPKLGLMSADTWAFVGSYIRNLLLVWLMFVPFLAAVLALPRLSIALLRAQEISTVSNVTRIAAGVLIFLATTVLASTRPVSYKRKGWLTNGRFLSCVLAPYAVAAVLLVVFWAGLFKEGDDTTTNIRDWWYVFAAFSGINIAASIWYMVRYWREMHRQRQPNAGASTPEVHAGKKFAFEVVAAAIAGAVGAALLFAATRLFDNPRNSVNVPKEETWQALPPTLSGAPAEMFLCFGVPLVLGILFVQATLFVGIASRFNEEYDREWWGRAGGWVLFAGVGWIVATAITIYGPVGIYYAPRIYAALTAATGLCAILLGKSGATGATDREKDEKAGPTQTGINFSLGIVAPVFAVAILALISLCTSLIMLAVNAPTRIDAEVLALRSAGTYQVREELKEKVPGQKWNFETARFAAIDPAHIAATEHLWAIDNTTPMQGFLLVGGLGLFSWVISFFLGANQFSMHGLYRNRLIRGYLGASHPTRVPNGFSGFDPTDNLQMDGLRPEVFWPSTIKNVVRDGPAIIAAKNLKFQKATIDAVKAAKAAPSNADQVRVAGELLADDLNRAIETLTLPRKGQEPQSVANRCALEAQFPGAFHPMTAHRRPLHVVGTTLNLVAGDDLAWQERKGGAFGISPLYSGNPLLGYRQTRAYGGPVGVSLGTAVAISGAFASPNMGYNSSPALSFLLTLFNVRLGWWLGNPKKSTYATKNPRNTLATVLAEAFGLTNEDHNDVYLSDGGHFDNLGLYEMVLRRCRCIVLSDAGADPEFGFDDLGNAIRKIRIDLGIDIEITSLDLFPRSRKDPSHPKYCAVAKIHYNDVDPGAEDGLLLYLKPAFYGKNEPKDVFNYASTYKAFPHQSTGDQWFSESQFESYRQLGYFALGELAKDQNDKTEKKFDTICELITAAEEYIAAGKPPATGATPTAGNP